MTRSANAATLEVEPFSPLVAINQRTLPEQVAEAIVSGIATGVFPTEQRLHEALLVERLRVSRAPIREALRILEAQGVLSSEPQKGHRVVAFDAQRVADCYHVRRAIEMTAVHRAAARLRTEPGLDAALLRILRDMEGHLAERDGLAMYRADLAFHSEIYRIAGNELFISLWRGLCRHFLIIFALEVRERLVTLNYQYRQHATLLEAMRTYDEAALSEEVHRHIAPAPVAGEAIATA